MGKLILVTNPGSASRKYALYDGEICRASLHFEYVDDKLYCEVAVADGPKQPVELEVSEIAEAASECERLLRQAKALGDDENIDAVAVRVVAPGKLFANDLLVDSQVVSDLEKIQSKSPLHVGVSLGEIKYFQQILPETPLVIVSDSSFHSTKPVEAYRYALDTDLQDKLDIGRFGYHGISVSSVVEIMKRQNILPGKLIVCHLGGGASISAVKDGLGVDNSMGYTALEGLMMATRSGDIDVAAAMAIKQELNLDDEGLENYLNKKSGFLGMSGLSDDMRAIIEAETNGDAKAKVANATYRYRLVKTIGAMAAALNGVDAIVFTATVGERGAEVRQPICEKLTYLGFEIDVDKNTTIPKTAQVANIATETSKPIYMIKTDELAEMARRALVLLG